MNLRFIQEIFVLYNIVKNSIIQFDISKGNPVFFKNNSFIVDLRNEGKKGRDTK